MKGLTLRGHHYSVRPLALIYLLLTVLLASCGSDSDPEPIPENPANDTTLPGNDTGDGGTTTSPNSSLVYPTRVFQLGFGSAIARSSDGLTLAISEPFGGAPLYNGKVHLFTRADTTAGWTTGPILSSDVPQDADGFGFSIKFNPDNDTLAVGAIGNKTGSVYLYRRNGDNWSAIPIQAAVIPSNITEDYNYFGLSLDFSKDNNQIAIGAPFEDYGYGIDSGGFVEVFSKTGSSWTQDNISHAYSLVSDLRIHNNHFGQIVKFSPDDSALAVGEYQAPLQEYQIHAGKVHVFYRPNLGWGEAPSIHQVLSGEPGNTFGYSLDFSADSSALAVGDYYGDLPDLSVKGCGRVSLFIRDGSWENPPLIGPVLNSSSPDEYDGFGQAVAFSPDNQFLVIAEPSGDPIGYAADYGDIVVYQRNGLDWTSQPVQGHTLINDYDNKKLFFTAGMEFTNDSRFLFVSGASVFGADPAANGVVNLFSSENFFP